MAQIPQPFNYGQPSLDYSPVVRNLTLLGQQIGQSIAQKQMRQDAESVMPAMQQAYAQAFQKMNDQDVAGAYQDIMNAQFTFGSLGNPMVDTMNKMAAESAAKAADGVYKKQLYGMQYGTSSSGLPAMSGADVVRQRAGRTTTTDQSAEDAQNTEVNKVPLPGEEDYVEPTGDVPSLTPAQEATRVNAAAYKESPPEQRVAYDESVVALNPPEKGYEKINIKGLEDFYGTNELHIPSKGTKIKRSYSISGKSTETGTTERLTEEEVEIGKDEYDEAKKMVKDTSDAISYISNNRPVDSKKTFKDIILEGGGPQYFDTAPNNGEKEDPERFPENLISVKTGEVYPLTTDQSKQIASLRGLTGLVDSRGLRFGEAAKPTAAKPDATAPATGGLPAVQAQAPAAAQAESRTIPSEAEGLYKQLGAIEAEEEKMSSSEKQNRIKQINKEIESLQKSATQKYSGFGLPGAGKLKTGSKERRDIERDILRVEQLVAERNKLEGKTTGKKISPMDQQALDWANANSNDPRARAIKQKLGM